MILSIDFDNTVAYTDFPEIKGEVPGAIDCLHLLDNRGHTLILNTCRTGSDLKEALRWLEKRDSLRVFNRINENTETRTKRYGDNSRKISCDIDIDDKNLWQIGKAMDWEKIYKRVKKLERPIIIAIVGESGTGKTTFAEYLQTYFGIRMIQSYTDRPKRFKGEKGHTFLTPKQFDRLRQEDMIAYTNWNGKRYCCLKKDVRDVNSYVIDEAGLRMLYENYNYKYDIWSVRLKRPYKFRKEVVGQERLDRDKDKFIFTDDYYDFVFNNVTNEMLYWSGKAVNLITDKIKLLDRV